MAKAKTAPKTETTGETPTAEVLQSEGLVPARRTYSLAQTFAPQEIEGLTVRRLSMPPIIKPKDIGPGVTISGLVKDIIESPVSTYKSQLLVMAHHSGTEFCLPITSSIRNSLERGAKTDNEKKKQLQTIIGQTLLVKGMGATKTASGRDVNLFEVFVVEPKKQ
jgi:hypothetical protein